MKIEDLRKKYPKFIYRDYKYEAIGGDLVISFFFEIPPDIKFNPKVVIKNVGAIAQDQLVLLDNLVFHLGLMEIPTYWKSTCAPVVEILAGRINKRQIRWWQNLFIQGMGEFFWVNKIDFRDSDFLKIISHGERKNKSFQAVGVKEALVLVSGGKDSTVTLELFKKYKKEFQCFTLNPSTVTLEIIKIAGGNRTVIAQREVDANLLDLNHKGFLNGHTPFSAYLAFLSLLVATINKNKYVVLSNERSSNEGNVEYLGKTINHQWSKSFAFEKSFRRYTKCYLVKNIEYFSYLRGLYEIQIARLFARYPKYFPIFLSCNEAFKTTSGSRVPTKVWCGHCPKCLFVFISLFPFLEEEAMLKIFKKNLLDEKELLPLLQQLIGERGFKPLECVGTKQESLVALYLSWKKLKDNNKALPLLLEYFAQEVLVKYKNLDQIAAKMLRAWYKKNYLPKAFAKDLEKELVL